MPRRGLAPVSTNNPAQSPQPGAQNAWLSAWNSFLNFVGRAPRPQVTTWQAWSTRPEWEDLQRYIDGTRPSYTELDWVKFDRTRREVKPRPCVVVSTDLLHKSKRCYLVPGTSGRTWNGIPIPPIAWSSWKGRRKTTTLDTCQVQGLQDPWLIECRGELGCVSRRSETTTSLRQRLFPTNDRRSTNTIQRGALVLVQFSPRDVIPSLVLSDNEMNSQHPLGIIYILQSLSFTPGDESDPGLFVIEEHETRLRRKITLDLALLRAIDRTRVRGSAVGQLPAGRLQSVSLRLEPFLA